MGNHGSRRDDKKWGKHGGKAAHVLNKVEELRGPSVDSYDKLIAWLAEMAENDNVQLDTSVFVSQLNRVCGSNGKRNKYLDVGTPLPHGGSGGHSSGNKRAPNLRQHSASCDSHVSHTSSELTQRMRSSVRSDDLLDPRSAWRSAVSSRQNTFSDDMGEEDSDVRNASMESLYSGSDRDSELGSLLPGEMGSKKFGKGGDRFARHSPIFQRLLISKLQDKRIMGGYYAKHFSCSTGNLDQFEHVDDTQMTKRPATASCFSQRRSVSLLDLSPPAPVVVPCKRNIPKVVLTRSDNIDIEDGAWGSDLGLPLPPTAAAAAVPILRTSTPVIKRQTAKFERMLSLHSEPGSTKSSKIPTLANLPPVFSLTTPETMATPPPAGASCFLDDALLDGNIADILFSVEALWPKK